jgi:hypothetical protein
MSVLTRALRLKQVIETDAAWDLLRKDRDHAAIAAAILAEHLDGEVRQVDALELYEKVDADLAELRSHGLDLTLTARAYLTDWTKAGYLVRRPIAATRGETFELSPEGLAAIRFLESREAPSQTMTESRLASLSRQLRQVAIDTDPAAERRLSRLQDERDRIDALMNAIRSGDDEPLSEPRALERIRDVIAQAAALPDDFARVLAEFEELNAALRAKILDSDESQRVALDDIFRGVDLIGQSPAGRSFSGFSNLVLDPVLGAAFDEDVRDILSREAAGELTVADRRLLRQLLSTLKDRTAEIHDVITAFAKGLRRYVVSQDYQRDRVLRRVLLESLSRGREVTDALPPHRRIGFELDLTAVGLISLGAIRLHDPTDLDASGTDLEPDDGGTVTLDELRAIARQTEIDFHELTKNVNSALTETGSGAVTVAEVLGLYPATQGVASVVGLLSLAVDHGVVGDGTEEVVWDGADRTDRRARVLVHRFVGRVDD